eukprot:2941832-Lingulodinium_polyedra.AAC.1
MKAVRRHLAWSRCPRPLQRHARAALQGLAQVLRQLRAAREPYAPRQVGIARMSCVAMKFPHCRHQLRAVEPAVLLGDVKLDALRVDRAGAARREDVMTGVPLSIRMARGLAALAP